MTKTDCENFSLGDLITLRDIFRKNSDLLLLEHGKRLVVVNDSECTPLSDRFFLIVGVTPCEGYQEFGQFNYSVLTSKGIYVLQSIFSLFFTRQV